MGPCQRSSALAGAGTDVRCVSGPPGLLEAVHLLWPAAGDRDLARPQVVPSRKRIPWGSAVPAVLYAPPDWLAWDGSRRWLLGVHPTLGAVVMTGPGAQRGKLGALS